VNVTVAELKDLARPMALEFAQELAPGGKLEGKYYLTRSPLRADRHTGSFAVWVKGAAAGAWKDFASDDKGDLIDLIAETKYGGRSRESRGKAIAWLRERLNLGGAAPAEIAKAKVFARAAQAEREKNEAAARERKRARCFDLWMSGAPLGGTLGEAYYRARGVEAAAIPNKSATFRFLPALDYWKGGAAAHRGPAIVGRYRDAAGRFPAVHATWLTADGRDKAPLDPPKLSLGEYKGCFLPIARGDGGKEPWEADCPAGLVQVTEGHEDGWSVAMARPDLRTWAAGSLSNIGNLPCPPCVSGFLVVRQNDWHTPAAVAAFERALESLARHGVGVTEIGVAMGKDPNDQLRRRG
jgi:hypothetical protein